MEIQKVIKTFEITGEPTNCYLYGNGHINVTYYVSTTGGKNYILQKINHRIFKDVPSLMNNIFLTTDYLRSINFKSMRVVLTKDGKLYHQNDEGYYRMYDFVEDSVCYEKVNDLKIIYTAGKAFGELHRGLANFDASQLKETIPDFHNTPKRYRDFLEACASDKLDRKKTCLPEIECVKSFADEYSKITDGLAQGEIAYAVTHNDPKINNILFDKDGHGIKAVIDLDTIMPGSYLFDFGDALRSLFTGDNEDSEDLHKLAVNFDVFEAYTSGYLSEMRNVLTPKEIELLPFSAFLLTIECGMRFLEDYLRGDIYFRTKYPTHNLIRARTQLTLAKDIYKNIPKLKQIIDAVIQRIDCR